MNTPNNRRRRDSCSWLEQAMIRLLERMDISEVTVAALCREARVNRSTFYANYRDIPDLAARIRERMVEELLASFHDITEEDYIARSFLALFSMVRENQPLFRACFKLGIQWKVDFPYYDRDMARRRFGERHLEYHIEFFQAGLNAVLHRWLDGNCRETPEELLQIIQEEYGRMQSTSLA